jgi:TolA-binding protein
MARSPSAPAGRGARLAAIAALGLGLGLGSGAAPAAAQEAPGAPRPRDPLEAQLPAASTIPDYLGELERLGVIDRSTGTPERLSLELGHAERALEQGDAVGAAIRLYGIVESPRFIDLADFPEYQNAEYDLVVALVGAGSPDAALAMALRIVARGPDALYFGPAHRRAVDIALETRDYDGVLAALDGTKLDAPLPVEASGERAYLRARALYARGDLGGAEGELTKISRKSRLYSSALYLRGVIRARRGQYDGASDAFCEIVENQDGDKYSFYVDGRYFTIKDLARLGLGRLAHEEDRYDDAYYHYFQIPDDSDRLPEALFEAAWSMYQKRELDTARDLVAELLKNFPDSPLGPEAMLLAAYIELADCKFDVAEQKFDQLVADLQPVVNEADAIRQSSVKRRALFDEAIAREQAFQKDPEAASARAKAQRPHDRVLAMLRLDPRFMRLHDAAYGLRRAAEQAPSVVAAWRQLGAKVVSAVGKVAAVTADASSEETQARKAAEVLEDVRRLRAEVRREKTEIELAIKERRIKPAIAADRLGELDAADSKLGELEARAAEASAAADRALLAKADPRLRTMIEADLARARALAELAVRLATKIDGQADVLARRSLDDLHAGLRRVLDKAKLGKIDAVIGVKRMLELEVEDLANGRFPPELYGRLYEAGVIGDDEIYWPPDAEYWKDEYSGWR